MNNPFEMLDLEGDIEFGTKMKNPLFCRLSVEGRYWIISDEQAELELEDLVEGMLDDEYHSRGQW